jgi:hypothetical protein
MPSEIGKLDVVQRLETILPGLMAFADAKASATRAKMGEVWSRRHPGREPPGKHLPPESTALDIDAIVEHADGSGLRVERSRIAADGGDLAAEIRILASVAALPEDIFLVLDDQRCYRMPGAVLHAFLKREREPDGDVIVISRGSRRPLTGGHSLRRQRRRAGHAVAPQARCFMVPP